MLPSVVVAVISVVVVVNEVVVVINELLPVGIIVLVVMVTFSRHSHTLQYCVLLLGPQQSPPS